MSIRVVEVSDSKQMCFLKYQLSTQRVDGSAKDNDAKSMEQHCDKVVF